MPLSTASKGRVLDGRAGTLDLIAELLWSLGVPPGASTLPISPLVNQALAVSGTL